jgi:hypothetical protein
MSIFPFSTGQRRILGNAPPFLIDLVGSTYGEKPGHDTKNEQQGVKSPNGVWWKRG